MTITAQEEHALVRAHQTGDPEAFTEITTAYRAGLLAHAQRRLRDRDAANDALQETLLRAYRAIDRFGGDQLLGAWLHRIVDNVCNDELARRRREFVLLERVGVPRDEHVDVTVLSDGSVENALAALPTTYRETLVLRAVEDLSFEEVAGRTGVTQENARARFHRARNMFRVVFKAPSAVLLPFVGFVARWRARVDVPSSGQAGATALGPGPTSPTVSALFSSPATTHLLTEVGSAPEKVSIAVKVLIAVAAAVPVAAATHSSPPFARPAAQQVEAASATEPAAGEPDPASQPAGTAAVDSAVTPPLSTAPVVEPTTTTTAPTRGLVPPLPAPEDEEPPGATDEAPPPGPAPSPPPQAALTGTLEIVHMRNGTVVYRGSATLTIGDVAIDGWLGCSSSSDDPADGSARSLRCWFYADDDGLNLTIEGESAPAPPADGRQLERYEGEWGTDTSSPDPLSGVAAVTFEVGADTAIADFRLDWPSNDASRTPEG